MTLKFFILFSWEQLLKLILISLDFHNPPFSFRIGVDKRRVIAQIFIDFLDFPIAHLINISCSLCWLDCWNHIAFYKLFIDIWQIYMNHLSKLALGMICNSNCSNFTLCVKLNPLVSLCEFLYLRKASNLTHENDLAHIDWAVLYL